MPVYDLNVKYFSGEEPDLQLFASFIKTGSAPKPILAYLHGWHGNRYHVARDLADNKFMLDRFFLVGIDMRGRGSSGKEESWGTANPDLIGAEGFDSAGKGDVSGWELNDVVDAVEAAMRMYPDEVLWNRVYVIGHSGGGGNTMSLLGKFPDYFTAAYAGSGMSDYGMWAELAPPYHESIEAGVGAKLEESREKFAGRGGLLTVQNRLTPISVSHGDKDEAVPIELSQIYVKANAKLGKDVPFRISPGGGHDKWDHFEEMVEFLEKYPSPPALPMKGSFVIAGYLKTRRFELILPSIDSVSECHYDLSAGLRLELQSGQSGTVKIRMPQQAGISLAKCTSAGKTFDIAKGSWNGWDEWRFEYAHSATVELHS